MLLPFLVLLLVRNPTRGPSPLFAAPQTSLSAPVVETLENGLQVAWFLEGRLPLVDLSLIVRAGQHEDPLGKSGTAELLAASLLRGSSGGKNSRPLSQAVDSLGGVQYATCRRGFLDFGIVHGLSVDAPEWATILGEKWLFVLIFRSLKSKGREIGWQTDGITWMSWEVLAPRMLTNAFYRRELNMVEGGGLFLES